MTVLKFGPDSVGGEDTNFAPVNSAKGKLFSTFVDLMTTIITFQDSPD